MIRKTNTANKSKRPTMEMFDKSGQNIGELKHISV